MSERPALPRVPPPLGRAAEEGSAMKVVRVCPDCGERSHGDPSHGVDRQGDHVLTICCPACHAKRQERLAGLESRYPSAEQLGLQGSTGEIPTERYRRPHSSGRRIVQKSEPMGG